MADRPAGVLSRPVGTGFNRKCEREEAIMPVTLPPAQYDHPPSVPVIEHVLTSDVVNRICHERHARDMDGRPASHAYVFSGCAHLIVTSDGKSCEVWRIDDGTVRRHEMGHCNG